MFEGFPLSVVSHHVKRGFFTSIPKTIFSPQRYVRNYKLTSYNRITSADAAAATAAAAAEVY